MQNNSGEKNKPDLSFKMISILGHQKQVGFDLSYSVQVESDSVHAVNYKDKYFCLY